MSNLSLRVGTRVRVVTEGPDAAHYLNAGDLAVVIPHDDLIDLSTINEPRKLMGEPLYFVVQSLDTPSVKQIMLPSDVEPAVEVSFDV